MIPTDVKPTETKAADDMYSGANVPVTLAAKIMRKDPMFIRIGLQRGILPFGMAIKKSETGKQFDYYISPKLFFEYTSCNVEDGMLEA